MESIKNLDRDIILKAISEIKNNPDKRNGRESTTYDLIQDGETFPPILVLSEANKLAGGAELTLSDFDNSTDKAFRILSEHDFTINSKENTFKSILSEIGLEKAKKYFDLLDTVIAKLGIQKNDVRIVFSLRQEYQRLAFTIGQRYCLSIEGSKRNPWRFITNHSESLGNKSFSFEGEPKAFYHKTSNINHLYEELDLILTACQNELERTTKSGFLKNKNSVFEQAVFNYEYRMEIFKQTFENFEFQAEAFEKVLNQFLDQARTDDLKTAHYKSSYNNLDVKVSFGQGNIAKIPWISFLHSTQSTSKGIYPVYLLYKKQSLLILAYGISETNKPEISWELDDPKSIEDYFLENNLGKPHRYGASYIYKVYDLEKNLNHYSVDKDLFQLTTEYKNIMENASTGTTPKDFVFNSILKSLMNSNLVYQEDLVVRFQTSLLTKPFLILTGLSGSGKTKLAQAFSKWIIDEEKQLNLVPVGADWTNREPLLGYPNALKDGRYVLPESGILQLILNAQKDPNRPYFLILDEMNLSHVERYFADFLSAIESNQEIKLHSGNEGDLWNGVPPTIKKIPKNLFVIGTVNIDETTYMFSPKVLDRANVIEFRVSKDEMERFLEAPADVDLPALEGKGASMANDFVKIATNSVAGFSDKDRLSKELIEFFDKLTKVGAEFGYRTASEIYRFASIAEQLAEDWEFEQVMDAAISQKLLPKLHGSRRKLESTLIKLADLCHSETEKGCEQLFKKHEDITKEVIDQAKYPISFEKIVRMHKGLIDNGFTSFAEA